MKTKTGFIILACLLAACQFQAHTSVQPDGSGELRTEVGFTAEERQNLIQQGSNTATDFCNSVQQSSRAATVTEEQRGEITWCVTTRRFDDLEELRQFYGEQKGITLNQLALVDEKFVYAVELDTSSTDSSFANFTAITWTVTLPGAPISHNAAVEEGRTLTWSVMPKSGVVELRAESTVEQASPAWLLPLIIALVAVGGVLVGVVVAVLVLRQRRA